MIIVLIMLIGVLIGFKLFPVKWLKINAKIQLVCICLLIFSMGVTLGLNKDFFTNILDLGFKSIIFAILPIVFSVIFVYFLTEKFLKKGGSNANSSDT